MGVEDLLQKHSLLEADINVVGERVKQVNGQAEKFVEGEFPEAEGYKPCDPQVVRDRMSHLDAAYEELQQLAADRRTKLEESRKLWQFYWDMADEDSWIKEKEQLMSSPDLGRDLTSVNMLLSKHKVRLFPVFSSLLVLPVVCAVLPSRMLWLVLEFQCANF